ncbi:ABC transporter permease, partial [Alistipes ihumii]
MKHAFNLKFFLRFLNRHRLYTAINVFGFSVSLMFVILIAAYVAKELSADRHHVNGDRIYRFEHQDFAYSAYAAGRVLQDRFPEIESYCVVSYENKTLRIGEEYMQVAVDCVDSSFFHMFTIELEQGDPRHVLATRDGVVINSKFAKTLFGEESPMGKVLDIDDRQLTVTGVFADFPYGIFRTPQLITSIFNTDNLWCIESYMDCHSWELFLMARRNADLPAKTESIRQCIKETGDYAFSHDEKAILRPMKDIFFDGFHFQNGGNKKFVLILAVVGLLILVFAVINYINLSVAQTGFRAREMAMRRMLGGTRRQLYSSIVAESILLCLFSFVLALLFSMAAENAFGWLVRTDVSVREAIDPYTAAGGLLFILLLGIVSGSIPAALISSYRPIEVMKGTFRQKT